MAYSKSINIILPTGSSDGPIELEMLNWNGMVIEVPRKEVDTYYAKIISEYDTKACRDSCYAGIC